MAIKNNLNVHEDLNTQQLLLQTVLDNLPVGVLIADRDGRALMLNKTMESIWQGKRELDGFANYAGYSAWDTKTKRKIEPDQWPISIAIRTGQPTEEYEFAIERFDKTLGYMLTKAVPILDPQGKVIGAIGVAQDITALKESEQLYRILFDNTEDGFALVQPLFEENEDSKDYLILKVNEAWERQTGLKAAQYEGKRIRETMPNVESLLTNNFGKVAKTAKSVRFENYNAASAKWYEIYAFPYKRTQVGVLFRDITERKKTEEALKLSGQRIHEILESITDDFMVLDRDWNYVYANSQAAKLIGLEPNTIVGKNFWALFPQNRGTEIERNLCEAMDSREIRRFELLGQYSKRCKLITTYPSVEGIALIATDITERKNLEKQLQENMRLAAIGATAGMVGHDIRNPLQAMMSDVFLLKELLTTMPQMPTKDEVSESLEGLEANIAYVNKIVADLQDYARPLKPEFSLFELSEVVSSVLKTVNLPGNVRLVVSVKAPNKIKSEATFIRRSLTNLVNNALQAMPDGGTLTIGAEERQDSVILTVEDTGVGIPDEVKPKLFSPMMTTKSKGQGLGLAVVKRLIEGIGGTVNVESQVGRGTKFMIELPITPR